MSDKHICESCKKDQHENCKVWPVNGKACQCPLIKTEDWHPGKRNKLGA